MKKNIYTYSFLVFSFFISLSLSAQTLEWRLVNPTYSSVDPDGAGPATGTTSFTLQIHSVSGTVTGVGYITTGFSYQSSKLMVPTTTSCTPTGLPSNVVISPEFAAAGYTYNGVNQCSNFTQTAGSQTYDRRTIGTMETTASIDIGTSWLNMMTITMWTLGSSNPEGGYVIINSGEGGTPGPFNGYAVQEPNFTAVVNSLTYNTPLELSAASAPISLLSFTGKVETINAILNWQTSQELNSSHFNLQRSVNGTEFSTIAKLEASGNSNTVKNYAYADAEVFRNLSTMYYRLEMVDNDGSKSYSKVVKLVHIKKGPEFALYPNPAKDVLSIKMKSDYAQKVNIQVVDMRGRVVSQNETTLQAGISSTTLQVSNLAKGEYMVIITGTERTVLKFVKE